MTIATYAAFPSLRDGHGAVPGDTRGQPDVTCSHYVRPRQEGAGRPGQIFAACEHA